MITIVSKLPYHVLSRNCRYGLNRSHLNITMRNYAKEPNQLCPPPKSKKDANTGTSFTLGAVALLGIGTIAYAKYDQQFRKFLGDNVPFADGFFKVIFQEEQPITDQLSDLTSNMVNMLTGSNVDIGNELEKKKKKREREAAALKQEEKYEPPHAVFPSIADKTKDKEEAYTEIRTQKSKDAEINIVKEKPAISDSPTLSGIKSVAELELHINDAATIAIDSYRNAEVALKEYTAYIDDIIEESVDRINPEIWSIIKKKGEEKHEFTKEAETNAKKALKDLEKLKVAVNNKAIEATETQKGTIFRNIDRIKKDVKEAKERFEKELDNCAIIERYSRKVECARKMFADELHAMFPDFDINKKKFNMQPSDLDLFLTHVFATVCYYQKEMNKLDIVAQQKLDKLKEASRQDDPNFSIVEAAIYDGIEREKRKLTKEFQKKCLALRKESEMELRHTLKCQEQAHIDHLADVVAAREAELERDFNRKLDEQCAAEQTKYKMQMSGMIARMKGMRNAISERVEADKIARQSQVLWSACQALHRAVKSNIPGIPWTEQMRPLLSEVDAIKKAAAEGDELVGIVLSGIPKEALERGVYPEGAIRERFLKVERVARRVALVPSDGAALPMYLLSFLQSMLLIQAVNPIPQAELEDEKCDFSCLNTYDILQRARYWLDRGNYAQALRYMNLLKGAAKCIARDWIKETRILLETQQAAETLMAHAVAGGLLHI